MPRAAGPFRRAIAQSASRTFFSLELADDFSLELADDIAVACAAELGLRPTPADLSSIEPAAVAGKMAHYEDRWGLVAHTVPPSRRSSTRRSCRPPRGRRSPPARLCIAQAGQLSRITDELYERSYSDWLFDMPSLHLAEAHAAAGGRWAARLARATRWHRTRLRAT
jgi:para-nitrobenzyl esterase